MSLNLLHREHPAWCNVDLDHTSPSQLNLPMSRWIYAYVLHDQAERRLWKANLRMTGGSAVNMALDMIYAERGAEMAGEREIIALKPDAAIAAATDYMLKTEVWDDDKDVRDHYASCIADTVTNAMEEVDSFGSEVVALEKYADWQPHWAPVPITGYADFILANGTIIELKTRWPRRVTNKAGEMSWRTSSNPSAPNNNWVKQATVYHHAFGGPAFVISANSLNARTYQIEEVEFRVAEAKLMAALLERHEALLQLQGADDRQEGLHRLLRCHPADFEDIYWNEDPDVLDDAQRHWANAYGSQNG